ncbi:hypothetical protein J2S24_002608 [Thermoanaerobacter pentosaceus]|uniref:Uncharacterized protein n=1 Tax=Thermoanaerobacter pentosaceus TaxID=694059 RepID=A0ABT9M7I0_9THEO|nr:hypothetical protein [Thermoanaerobacter pentosaceus]
MGWINKEEMILLDLKSHKKGNKWFRVTLRIK